MWAPSTWVIINIPIADCGIYFYDQLPTISKLFCVFIWISPKALLVDKHLDAGVYLEVIPRNRNKGERNRSLRRRKSHERVHTWNYYCYGQLELSLFREPQRNHVEWMHLRIRRLGIYPLAYILYQLRIVHRDLAASKMAQWPLSLILHVNTVVESSHFATT